ncbi:MAG: DUF3656 domain-containing protein [Pirellulaceae bacterium]
MKERTELMSPAGYWPQLHAAIEAGADAVYFGLKHFSARAKVGFELAELPEVMRTLHRRSVKGYVTFNTLIFDHEIIEAERAIIELARAGVDAVIVQDIGMAKLISELVPDLAIHGSTQMSVTSAEGAELARSFGCSRVVLARELSLTDIRKIKTQTTMELETFVHGALCVSYSGQCFSSEAWGGRSANRGQCAQACRLDYELIVDGQVRDLGAARYLLSPGDLMALDCVDGLVDAGVSCLKIEGRYKDAEYVALTTKAYRRALDDAFEKRPLSVDAQDRQDLEQIYSRGLGPFFMSGTDHQQVVVGRAPRHRGVFLGQVVAVERDAVVVETKGEIRRGDGLVFDAADRRKPEGHEQGGFVFDIAEAGNGRVRVRFGNNALELEDIQPGDWGWRTLDPQLEKKAKPYLSPSKPVRTRPVRFEVNAVIGQPLELMASLENGKQCAVFSNEPLQAADKNVATLSSVRGQLERLGGTPFHVAEIVFNSTGPAFIPSSWLNQLRREAVKGLEQQLARLPAIEAVPTAETRIAEKRQRFAASESASMPVAESRIHLLVRTPEQLDGAIEAQPDSITLDYLELYGLRNSVERVRAAGIRCRVASPRILKPAEQNVVNFLRSLEVDILARSGGLLHDLLKIPELGRPVLDGDFSLNAANVLSCSILLESGVSRLNPTHDLNAVQIIDLAKQIDPSRLEVTALHHLPIFHMEHCVFCRFLSEGTDNTNCGHPCEQHRVAVRDSSGRAHPVLADVGCRNTVFNAELQSAAEYLERFLAVGLRDFRLEFVHQSAAEVSRCASALRQYFRDRSSIDELAAVWQAATPAGSTSGSLYVPRDFKKLVQLGP